MLWSLVALGKHVLPSLAFERLKSTCNAILSVERFFDFRAARSMRYQMKSRVSNELLSKAFCAESSKETNASETSFVLVQNLRIFFPPSISGKLTGIIETLTKVDSLRSFS